MADLNFGPAVPESNEVRIERAERLLRGQVLLALVLGTALLIILCGWALWPK